MDELLNETKKNETMVEPVVASPEAPLPTLSVERGALASEGQRPEIYVIAAGVVTVVPALEPQEQTTGRGRRKAAPRKVWTPARRRYTAEYIANLQGLLRLRDWEIRVDFDTSCEDDELATMTPYEDQKRAVMRFGAEFLDLPADDMRQTLVHELIHCHLFSLHHLTERIIGSLGGDKAMRAGLPGVTASVELTTDALADAFAPLIPVYELPTR